LAQSSADILVLTEFRENSIVAKLREALTEAGWTYIASSNPQPAVNGVLVASRLMFTPVQQPDNIPEGCARFIECNFERFVLIGVYFPLGKAKLTIWPWFIGEAGRRARVPCFLVGDFNIGKHFIDEGGAVIRNPEYMDRIEELGYVDAWRMLHPQGREYTWFSHRGNGFRLDYVFISAPLAGKLIGAEHLHEPRELKISDHSALSVTICDNDEVNSGK